MDRRSSLKLCHDAIRKLADEGSVQMSLFDACNLAEIRSPLNPDERLVVCSNTALAARRRHKREALLAATEETFGRIQREVQRRTKNPLRATEIAKNVGRAQQRFKVAKHFETVIEDDRFEFSRESVSIEREADLTAEDIVRSYQNLTRVERAFRCLKTVDLMVRPIRQRAEERVRAHIFLCLLADYVEWHLRQARAPLLF